MATKKASDAAAVPTRRPGGSRSGPRPTTAELKARGAAYKSLYVDPEWAAQIERLRVALELPEARHLGAVLRAATDALEASLKRRAR